MAFELANLLTDLEATRQEWLLARDRVQDSEAWVRTARVRYSSPPSAGRSKDWLIIALDDYQFALRRHVDGLVDASRLLGRFNSLLARLHEAQGTLLDQRLVELDNDPLKTVQENAPLWFGEQRPGWSR